MTVENRSKHISDLKKSSWGKAMMILFLLPLAACFSSSESSSSPPPHLDRERGEEISGEIEVSKAVPSEEAGNSSQPPLNNDDSSQTPQNPTSEDSKTELPILPTTPIATLPNTTSIDSIATNSQGKATDQQFRLAGGTFLSGEHPTKGAVTITDDEGTPIIYFDNEFQTTAGPDLVVVLHISEDVLGNTSPPAYALQEGDYVEISPLKANQGEQKYSIPAAIIFENYNSIAIWCRTFNATFGSAALSFDNK